MATTAPPAANGPSFAASAAMPMRAALPVRLGALLMLASGFAALGEQIVWTQQAGLWLGHEAAGVLAVVAAFFGGLGLGALALGGRIERSARPQRWYAACEAVVGLWTLVLVVAMTPAAHALLAGIGAQPSPLRHAVLAFGGVALLLLPATAAMGATLPAAERMLAMAWASSPLLGASGVARLYAANTAGAVAGVLTAAFVLVPALGLAHTAAVCAALNLAAAALTFVAWPAAATPLPAATPAAAATPRRWGLLAATGFLGIGYEVLVVRVLSQVAENTVYTFALLLAVYLVGSALGAAVWARRPARWRSAADATPTLLRALAGTVLLGTAALYASASLKQGWLALIGPGVVPALSAEALIALAAFGLPTLLMGALFSHLAEQAAAHGSGLGRALAANTLGAALAPPVCGVLLLPAVGAKPALLALALGYLMLSARAWWKRPASRALAVAIVGVAVWAPPLAFVDVPPGGRVVDYREGASAAVSVVEDAEGVRRLRIDNRQQEGSSATVYADARQAMLPLLLHPAPRRALFLGLGTGVTATSAAQDRLLEVDAAELLPEVIAASAQFRDVVDPRPNPRLHLLHADARRYVRAASTRYDVIVADNFHPARAGSGALYTVEHFRAVRARLAEGGVFCQWLPLHQLDLRTLRSIVASFVAVNPQAVAVLAHLSLETPVLGLVVRAGDERIDLDALRGRLAASRIAPAAAAHALGDELAVLGSIVAGPAALQRFAADAPVNTDDRPVVAHLAPAVTYAPDSLPRERLLAVLEQFAVSPQEVLDGASAADTAFTARLARYWAARDRFLAAGRAVTPTADARQMLAQVRAPLLDVLAISADFRPAIDPLRRLADALRHDDPAAARALDEQLDDALRRGR